MPQPATCPTRPTTIAGGFGPASCPPLCPGGGVLPARAVRFAGLTPFSSVDWPGLLSAVLFWQGCPWACPYCHNPHLQDYSREQPGLTWAEAREFLSKRRGCLDAAVFSGGEPTSLPELPQLAAEAQSLGFKVGLHTAGPWPQRLRAIVPHVDWVGFDCKAPWDKYDWITGRKDSALAARASLQILLNRGVDFEVRTTVHLALLSPGDILRLGRQLAGLGVRTYALQAFRAQGCADEVLRTVPGPDFASPPWKDVAEQLGGLFPNFFCR